MVIDDLIDVDDDPFKFSVSNFATQIAAVGIKQVFDVICQKRVQVFHQGFQTPRNR